MTLVPTTPEPESVPRRPDASMSLIANLTTPHDHGVRPGGGPPPNRPAVLRIGRSAVLALVFVAAGLVIGISARLTNDSAPAARAAHNELVDRVRTRTAQSDALQRQLSISRSSLGGARADALVADSAGSAARSEIARLSILVGLSPVHGPGVRVTVEDAPGDSARGPGSTGRIRDTDLQRLLNGLWAAGAEAISVNGQRLGALTAVRTAGDAILVGYRPLSPPYEVLAIGSPTDLEVDFVDGPAGRWFHALRDRFGIRFSVSTQQDLVLPAATATTLHLAREGTAR